MATGVTTGISKAHTPLRPNASRLHLVRTGQALTATLFNEHVTAINRLNDAGYRYNRRQKGDDAQLTALYTLVEYETVSVQVPLEDDQGTPTGEFARADLLTVLRYADPDGGVTEFDHSILEQLYP